MMMTGRMIVFTRDTGSARPACRNEPSSAPCRILTSASLALPHRLALREERLDALGSVLEREHACELALEVAELRLELEILRAIERAQAERERGRAAIRDLVRERHRR